MIRIVTDSPSNIPKEYLERYGITVVPSIILFGKEEFREGVDLSYEEFCTRLKSSKEIPKTLPPTSIEFLNTYTELEKEADFIFSIHISSLLSNNFRNATIAQGMFAGKKREKPSEAIVIDTKTLDMGSGMIVLEAAKAAKEGRSKEEIEKLVNDLIEKMDGYSYVDTVDYLVKSGRVKRIAGILAGLLNMKPIITIEKGEIIGKDKAMGRDKALEKIFALMRERIRPDQRIKVAVLDAMAKDDGDNFLKTIQGRFNCVESLRTQMSTTVTIHAGPGALSVFYHPI